MDDAGLNSYLKIKRRIFLAVLSIVFIYTGWYWLHSPVHDTFIHLALFGTALCCFILWILFYRNFAIRVCEFVCLGMFTLYHLGRIYTSLHAAGIDLYLEWSGVYDVCVFMVLQGKKGLAYALFIYMLTLCIGVPDFHQTNELDGILTHFFVANIIYIVVLYYFQRLLSASTESTTLRKMAYQDYLTNIANRRMIDRWIEEEIEKSEENNTTFSIVYFDIDHFKQLNDQFGHHVGDDVLREFADVVKSTIRESDYFGRWGGEEFIIVSPNVPEHETEKLAERLRKTLEKHSFRTVGNLTASFGISSFSKSDLSNTLLHRADHALYVAKNSGRNTVRVAEV
jgi:diguanylate cyclase (GGDEF)-like protein